MSGRKWLILILILAIAPFGIISCSKSGGSSKKSPTVTVVDDTGNTGNTGGVITDPTKDTVAKVIIVNVDSDGTLPINGESLDPKSYNPSNSGSSSTIAVTDEHGQAVTDVTVDEDGNIQIRPVDGSAAGTYTVVITVTKDGNTREYDLVINVSDTGVATVVTSISHPSGTSVVLDLSAGGLTVKTGDTVTVSGANDSVWSLDGSIHSITVTDKNGNAIPVFIDPVTGDVIAKGTTNAPYTIVIETDTRTITVTTDKDGKVTQITESGKGLVLDLDNGNAGVSGISLDLTASKDGSYALEEGVSVISVKAGNGAIEVDTNRVIIDKATGDIYIRADSGNNVPAGPYEIKVSVDGKIYVIKTDETGKVTSINPGSVVLELSNGKIMFNDVAKLEFATSSTLGGWSMSSDIKNLGATDANGKTIALSVDSSTGNIVTTSSSYTDPVTITFMRTDANGNVITYTIVVQNGGVISYTAAITDPGSNFDYSTVTNVSISLNVVDGKKGTPVGQASISMLNGASNLWEGFTNDAGISIFSATVDAASKTTKVIASKSGYANNEIGIDGIGRLVEICKRITLTPNEAATVTDTDHDGVADADDEFPNDPSYAKTLTNSTILAFEDNYKYSATTFDTGNDADFNDMVVKLTSVEYINGQNKVMKINVTAECLVAHSGRNSAFGIAINGQGSTVLFTKARLGNSQTANLANVTKTFEFANGISRSDLGAFPYDPYMIPANMTSLGEVHLASVNTSYTGVRKGDGTIKTANGNVSIKNFVWALMLPTSWKWPYESTCIGIAYPKFVNWCNSAGTEDTEWYNSPVSGKVE